ncbi:MAG: hypothetical protein LC800_06390 [Acidobacteria bacterium]|nr:hypothetical protein [Acidobacteriota bacterium]
MTRLGRKRNEKLTRRERATHGLLQTGPWLSVLLLVFPAPAYFLLRYLAAGEGAGEWMLLALTSLVAGSLAALVAVVTFLILKRLWARRLRERLAADGVTADELDWFHPELTRAERGALKEIESGDLLLAEAYRETLASRLTATRLLAHSRREKARVERRLAAAHRLNAPERAALEEELRADRARLARVEAETLQRHAQAQTRLRTIEAAASRAANEQGTRVALDRLEGQTRGRVARSGPRRRGRRGPLRATRPRV